MKTADIIKIYETHDSEKLYSVLLIMTNRKKYKQFDKFNTPEQVDNSIKALVDILTERGIVFKTMTSGKWVEGEFTYHKTFIKLYTNTVAESGEMTFEAIGQY